ALWERVLVPVRILESPNDELVRSVTVNNNRQNSMSPAALRSNDVVQIRLEQRFRERRIMYQRQEGAFDAVFGSSPELLDDEFENTQGRKVDIHELSRAIAAALGKLDWALHPNDLFEADKSYETCFDEKRTLNSIVFLTFLQNLHDVVGIVLKMDLNLVPKGNGPKPSRLLYHTICLLTRYLAREKDYAFVKEWGTKLYGRKPSFREATRKLLNSNKSRIRTELSSCFMALESKDAVALKDAFERCQKHLGLKDDRDPFVVFADLDGETPVLAGGEFEE
ncbi:MAG: AIPR family protein, partial [Planctomycetes bacterium]|nr:AIPR family protein [Planctomycetota bacterium]